MPRSTTRPQPVRRGAGGTYLRSSPSTPIPSPAPISDPNIGLGLVREPPTTDSVIHVHLYHTLQALSRVPSPFPAVPSLSLVLFLSCCPLPIKRTACTTARWTCRHRRCMFYHGDPSGSSSQVMYGRAGCYGMEDLDVHRFPVQLVSISPRRTIQGVPYFVHSNQLVSMQDRDHAVCGRRRRAN